MMNSIVNNDYLNVMFILVGLIVFVVVATFLLKKLRSTKISKAKQINILNMVSLGSKEKIALLEVKDTTILVGITPHAVNTLHVFAEELLPEELEKFTFSKQMAELAE